MFLFAFLAMAFSALGLHLKTSIGNDIQSAQMFGDLAGVTSTATAVSSTTMTDSGASFGTNVYAGHFVTLGACIGVIISHTGTVLTIDQWSTPGSSDTAASTPSTGVYIILPGNAPARHMALSTSTATVVAGDTTLGSEITTSGGGLVAKRGTYAHTTSAASATLTGIWTANGTDSLPVTIGKLGIRQSIKTTCNCLFQTLFSATATLSASGDQLTATDTFSL